MKKKKKSLHLKHKIALFIVYFILFGVLSAMVDYYAYDFLNPWIFVIISFIGAIIATVLHVRSRQKTKADELAEDIEEVI